MSRDFLEVEQEDQLIKLEKHSPCQNQILGLTTSSQQHDQKLPMKITKTATAETKIDRDDFYARIKGLHNGHYSYTSQESCIKKTSIPSYKF